jgi:hypothetical protein
MYSLLVLHRIGRNLLLNKCILAKVINATI